jgi:YD repeat-containing protein
MYRKYLLALLLCALPLSGDPTAPHSAAVDPLGFVHGCVSVITGDYIETKPDLVVNCHEPVALWRVHVSDANSDRCHSQWHIGCDKIETEIWNKVAFSGHLFYRQDETGAIIRFRVDPLPEKWSLRPRGKEHWQALPVVKGYSNTSSGELSGQTNLLNDHLLYASREERFTLTRGNGEQRIYRHHGNWSRKGLIKKMVGFCSEAYGNKPKGKRETFLLSYVRRPNGNIVHYRYDDDGRPVRIWSTNADNSVAFGSISLTYHHNGVVATTSDGQTLIYHVEKEKGRPVLRRVIHNDEEVANYGYHTRSRTNNRFALIQSNRPDGRTRHIDYYYTGDQHPYQERVYIHDWDFRRGRVSLLCEPSGPDGQLTRRYAFYYGFEKKKWGIDDLGWIDVFDGLGQRTRYYKEDHHLTKVVHFDGHTPIKTIRQAFDGSNLISRSIDGGSTRRFTYDDRHNVIEEYLDDLLLRTCTYGHFNLLTSETLGDLTTTYTYQPKTNLLLHKQTYTHDTLIQEEHFAYDHNAALIRHETHSGPQHLTTHTTYDPLDRPISTTDPYGNTTTDTYDSLSRLTAQTLPTGATHTCTYDLHDRPLTQTDPLGHTTHTIYDSRGNPLTITYPDSTTETFTYNPAGHLLTHTARTNLLTTYTRDALGRPTSTTTPHSHTQITYTGHLLASHTDPLNLLTTYTYDQAGRPLIETTPETTIAYTTIPSPASPAA